MQPWSLLVIRNWQARPGRAMATTAAIALGVATVVWVTCSYESVRRSISEQVVDRWVGRSHLSVESTMGHWGTMDERIVPIMRSLEGVTHVTARLRRPMYLVITTEMDVPTGEDFAVDALGIDPSTEQAFRTYNVEGRIPRVNDRGKAVLEAKTAGELGLAVGDRFTLEAYESGPSATFEIVGLMEVRRVAKFQRPMVLLRLGDLQRLAGGEGKVTIVDAMLADPSGVNVERCADALRAEIRQRNWGYQVTTSTARLNQLKEAQDHTEFALMLVAGVALLTSFFIILTTMNMGIVERIGLLGMMRCVGMTRGQLAGLVLFEAVPLGVVGVLAGIPIGLALTRVSGWLAPEYVQQVAVSVRGIVFASIGGMVTTLAGALMPALQASRVSPLAAARPQANARAGRFALPAAVLGAAMVAGHFWMVRSVDPADWMVPVVTIAGIALLYGGYGLVAPLAVRVLGPPAVYAIARVLRLGPSLLHDQVGRAAWRGAGICCGLMVGLSLLISVVVHAESVRAGWDFPKRLAEAFVWTRHAVPSSFVEPVRSLPGMADCTVINDFLCDVGQSKSRFFNLLQVKSTFVAGESDVFLTMTKLEFLEGNYDDAYEKMGRGGYILLPHEASRAFGLHLGDEVPITAADRTAVFEVAGVVQSPALDIAVTYFQADSYMMLAAAGSVLGTLDDAKKHFGVEGVSLFLMNFTLPDTPPPALFENPVPPTATTELLAGELLAWGDRLTNDRENIAALRPRLERWAELANQPFEAPFLLEPYRRALAYTAEYWADARPADRWEVFCDQLLMGNVLRVVNRPDAIFGSLRRLKQRIDEDIAEATMLLAAIPLVALLVAALGVGNLMTANVLSRTREVAVLRTTGATQWQIMRLVLAEAIVLGAIGSVMGFVLGVHSAHSMNELTLRAIGFAPKFSIPWSNIAVGIGLTVGVCVLAGLAPARHAARSNIIEAMRGA